MDGWAGDGLRFHPGLLLLGHRYYDPGTGRFVTRDPAGYGGGVNLYGFAGGNPVNEIDPEGTRRYYVHNPAHYAPSVRVTGGKFIGSKSRLTPGYDNRKYIIDIPNSQSLAVNMDTALDFRKIYNPIDVLRAKDLLGPYVADNTMGDYGKKLDVYKARQNDLGLRYERRLGGNFNFGAMGAAMHQSLGALLLAGHAFALRGKAGNLHPQIEQDAIEDGFYYFYLTHPSYMKTDGVQLPQGLIIHDGPDDHDPD